MKKLLALALAASMVASMGATAFASHNIGLDPSDILHDELLKEDDGRIIVTSTNEAIPYGDTAYFALVGHVVDESAAGESIDASIKLAGSDTPVAGEPDFYAHLVYEADAIDGLKISADWDMGESLVEDIEIVKKRAVADGAALGLDVSGQKAAPSGVQSYAYFVAVELKESTSTDEDYVSGTLEFNKNPGESKVEIAAGTPAFTTSSDVFYEAGDVVEFEDIDDVTVDISFPVQFSDATVSTDADDSFRVYDFDDGDEEEEIVLIDDDTAIFVVNTIGQDEVLIAASTDYNVAVSNKYPTANLDFLTMNGATFNKTGELFIYADEDSDNYLYIINSDGTLSESGVEYDSSEEAFILKTRTLGQYVISDRELDIEVIAEDPEVDEAPELEPIVPPVVAPTPNPNPGTGVNA